MDMSGLLKVIFAILLPAAINNMSWDVYLTAQSSTHYPLDDLTAVGRINLEDTNSDVYSVGLERADALDNKFTTTAENQNLSLQPCASGRVCTDEGSANWECWMVTRIPPLLTGRNYFSLSSSEGFTVYLECEQSSENGLDCALKSDRTPSQMVPVQTLPTLPDNIIDNWTTGAVVKKRRLSLKKLTRDIFFTKTSGKSISESVDFLVSQKDINIMLKTRPDTYRGAVTEIFDPDFIEKSKVYFALKKPTLSASPYWVVRGCLYAPHLGSQ